MGVLRKCSNTSLFVVAILANQFSRCWSVCWSNAVARTVCTRIICAGVDVGTFFVFRTMNTLKITHAFYYHVLLVLLICNKKRQTKKEGNYG
jgi:hypothetical protein